MRVSNSYLKDTEVNDSLVFDSCLYKTSILGNSCVDRAITAAVLTTLVMLACTQPTGMALPPICGFKAVGDRKSLVLSHYRGIRYPVVAIGDRY